MGTVEEWSSAFDVYLAEYLKVTNFGFTNPLIFDEYEKSLFLTKAQEEIVKELYSGKITGTSFESNEEVRRQLELLIYTQNLKHLVKQEEGVIRDKFNHYHVAYPDDCWYIIYEQVITTESENKCFSRKVLDVYPITHDEYNKIIKNPFRGPGLNRVLRLSKGDDELELVSSLEIDEYTIRFIGKPTPIVLCDLASEGLSIDNVSTPTPCFLSDLVHQNILTHAVQLAVSSRQAAMSNNK